MRVIALNLDPRNFPDEFIQAYSEGLGYEALTWAQDEEQRTMRAFGVRTLGATAILNPSGRVVYQDPGYTSYDVLKREVERALAQ